MTPTGHNAHRSDTDDSSLLTYKEVADRLSIPEKRVYELPIPQVRLGPATIRWRPADLENFIDTRRTAA